jgi:catechol 2,3-dioxygenase-like lactoylglutathione lyase family enzyme
MRKNRLFLVSLVVDRYDRAKTFYCDGLGFDCVEDAVRSYGTVAVFADLYGNLWDLMERATA